MDYLIWETSYSTLWGKFLFSIPFVLGSFVGAFLYSRSLVKRKYFFLRTALCLTICIVTAYFCWPWATSRESFLYLFIIGTELVFFQMVVVSMLFCYRCSVWDAIFYAENGLATFYVVKILFDVIGVIIVDHGVSVKPYGFCYSVLYFLLAVVLYILVDFLFVRHMKSTEGFFVDKRQMIVPTLVVLSIAIVCNIYVGVFIYRYNLGADIIFMLKMVLLVCCFLVLFINFSLFAMGRQQREIEIIQSLNRQRQEQFEISKENIENINVRYHDLKGQLSVIRKLANDPELADSLQEIESQIGVYDSIAKTGNEFLDVILTEKSLYCNKNDIKFNYMIDGERLAFLAPMDLISLFGNLIGNAVESVLKLEQKERRVISLSTYAQEYLLYIHSENFYTGKIKFESGLPVTTKEDATNHGYGMKSIRMIVEKYGGRVSVTTTEDLFACNIVIPLPKSAK